MFGLKLKSWMEAHLGRHHRQKSTSSSAGPTTGTSIPSLASSSSTTCSSSSPAPLSSQSHLQKNKQTPAPKDISSGSFSSTSNSTTSSSNGSTSTAIGVGSGSFGGNNNPTFCNFQQTTTSTTNTSVAPSTCASSAVGFPESEKAQQQQEVKIGKYCGGGGSSSTASTEISHQKGDTVSGKDSEHEEHLPGESLKRDPTTSSSIPASSCNSNRASTVSTSVSNSTSIISGGSSFCNSLSSPDTGYSTDGYSPKSVYPALSFPAENSNSQNTSTKLNSNSCASSTSKSFCTISSLVSSELLHSSSKQTSASGSVQDGLDERATSSPPISLLVSSQSSSSGISEGSGGGGLHAPFPKGLHSTSIPENESTDEGSKESQVIMGVDGDSRAGKKTIQLELEQKCGSVSSSSPAVVKASSKFSPFSIDFFKRTSTTTTTSIGGDGGNGSKDNVNSNEQSSTKPSHGRTHRRAESMDARTPSHEDYKPLVEGDEDNGEGDMSGSNPSSSHFMTTTSSSSFAAAGGKSIRTSFILNNSGQLVEFNAYKNAFSICSPRRERTRIKTNPWITLSNNKNESGEETCNKSDNNKSTHANSNSDGEKVKSESGESTKILKGQESKSGVESKRVGNLVEINKRSDSETDNFMEDETGIVDHDSDDRSSSTQATSHVLYRISSASDSGKGSLVETETNRNSTESSCLLSEDSTRNSIISQEAVSGGGSSCCGRSSSGESISQHAGGVDTVKKSDEQDEKEQQKEKASQKKNGDQGQRTFRNASVATDLLLVKSASVSVGVGTTGSNKSATKKHPVMVDKETDILSDWATNTDVETEDDLETDRDDEDDEEEDDGCNNNEDNETVTPAPSSPDRALFSQSSSATTDIDFGDSSAATQASSTQVFPPSSLLRQHNNGSSSTYANMNSNGVRFCNNSSNNNSQSESCGGESYEHHYHLQQQQQQQNNNINLNASTSPQYPAVIPIVRPVLAAAQQQDTFSFDLVNNHHHHLQHQHHHTLQPQQQQQFAAGKMFYPHFPLEDDLLEDDYPQVKQSKGLARGALGFLRKIFKKGACASQRHSPESLASSAVGKKGKRGKSDNNLTSLGSPLLTISEPLSNPRYSAAVLTTKKQLNGCYFLTPTPNSFRRRSGGNAGGIFGGQSDSNNSGSDSKGSTGTNKQQSKSVKTDIIRLPQGPLSPPQSIIQQRATSSSHSTGSSSSCSVLSSSNGIPQQCSTFLPHAAPVITSAYFPGPPPASTNSNLIPTISQQSNPPSNNSSSTSSSVHSLMSTSTCSGNNRPPSQNMSKAQIPIQNPYANSTSGTARHSTNPFLSSNNNSSTARSPPPPLISENSPYLNNGTSQGLQKSRRDPPHPQQSRIIPPYESSSPRPPPNSSAPSQVRMNSPSFNNSYSPIHRLVVTGGSHLRPGNPAGQHYPIESPVPIPRYNGNTDNNSNNFSTQVINRSHHHPPTSISQSPLINHRSSPHPQQQQQYPISSSTHQQSHNFFASPSPILRNPRYQYITSSNQNSPVLNGTKRLNASSQIIMPCSSSNSTTGPGGPPPPLLTTFTPLPSTSSSASTSQRESLINNNNNGGNTNTITIGSSNLNPSSSRQVVSTSLSYNEFENLSRQQNFFHNNKLNGNNSIPSFISPAAPPHLQQQHQQPQQLLHQSHHHTNNKTHHLHQNHYYSSPIVKQRQRQNQLEQTFWNNNGDGGGGGSGGGRRQYLNLQQQQQHQQQQIKNQNLRFNSFLVRHRQLPQFYHTQWGLQERIYETVDSEDERSNSGVVLEGDEDTGGFGGEWSAANQNRGGRMTPRMKHSFSLREGGFLSGGEGNQVNGGDFLEEEEENRPTKRSKPKTLSASGRPFPRPVVALPMMPAGTFLSETETRLLECDKESDRKYKRLINEAEALLKEISVEKEKRAAVHAAVGGGVGGAGQIQRDNNSFRLEDCPQSDPLRRKAYDCWALRRLQQELAGCCASPPVLHRSRLNLQSPSTPTLANNPYLNTFQSLGMSMPPMLPQQVPYLNCTSATDPNQNSFEF